MPTISDIKLRDLREAAKEELTQLLGKTAAGGGNDKSKGVIIEPQLLAALNATGLVDECFTEAAGVKWVQPLDVGMDAKKEFHPEKLRSLVILVRPSLPTMKAVASLIYKFDGLKNSLKYYIFFVPKKTFICCHMLELEYQLAEKYGKRLEIDEFELDFIQLEEDVLSMELPFVFRDVFMEGDTTSLQYISKAIVRLQTAKIGLIPHLFAKGNVAVKTLSFLKRMIADVGAEFMQEQASQVDRLYLIDRGVDLVTPMLTQLTYEGIIDENYGIQCGALRPPFEVSGLKPAHKGVVRLNNSVDEVFSSLRDLNIATVGPELHKISLSVKKAYDQRKELSKVKDLKNFLFQIPERYRLVEVHTTIATQLIKLQQNAAFRKRIEMEHNVVLNTEEKDVIEYVDELLNRGESLLSVLRFLALMSVTNGGLKPKVFDAVRESFMMSYGIPQTLAAWYSLERAGLLTKNTGGILAQAAGVGIAAFGQFHHLRDRDGKVPFAALRKACKLWVDNLNEQAPNDVGYAYSGYAPLALRVVEAMDDFAAKVEASGGAGAAGRTSAGSTTATNDTQRTAAPTGFAALDQAPGDFDMHSTGAVVTGTSKTAIIFVIGGMTSAEISAVRTVLAGTNSDSETSTRKTSYIIATTCVTNGIRMIESLLPFDAAPRAC